MGFLFLSKNHGKKRNYSERVVKKYAIFARGSQKYVGFILQDCNIECNFYQIIAKKHNPPLDSDIDAENQLPNQKNYSPRAD